MGFSEEQVIEVLASVFSSQDPRIILGIGDDAALVRGSQQQILTTDIAVEGVHFRRDWSSAYEIGRRIAAANIADVLSMNGRCDYLLVAATLTGNESIDWIRDLAQGIQDQASEAGAVVVGGDFNIAPEDRDVYDMAAFEGATHVSQPERDALAHVNAFGMPALREPDAVQGIQHLLA